MREIFDVIAARRPLALTAVAAGRIALPATSSSSSTSEGPVLCLLEMLASSSATATTISFGKRSPRGSSGGEGGRRGPDSGSALIANSEGSECVLWLWGKVE